MVHPTCVCTMLGNPHGLQYGLQSLLPMYFCGFTKNCILLQLPPTDSLHGSVRCNDHAKQAWCIQHVFVPCLATHMVSNDCCLCIFVGSPKIAYSSNYLPPTLCMVLLGAMTMPSKHGASNMCLYHAWQPTWSPMTAAYVFLWVHQKLHTPPTTSHQLSAWFCWVQ